MITLFILSRSYEIAPKLFNYGLTNEFRALLSPLETKLFLCRFFGSKLEWFYFQQECLGY